MPSIVIEKMIPLLYMEHQIIVGLKKEMSNLLNLQINLFWKFILVLKKIHMCSGYCNFSRIKLKFTNSSLAKLKLKKMIIKIHKNSNSDFILNIKNNLSAPSHKLLPKTYKMISFSIKIIQSDKGKTTLQCIKWNQNNSIRIVAGWKIWIRTSSVLVMTLNKYLKPCNKRCNKVNKTCKINHTWWTMTHKLMHKIKAALKKDKIMKSSKEHLETTGG